VTYECTQWEIVNATRTRDSLFQSCVVSTSKYDSEMVCATLHFFVVIYSIVNVCSRTRFKMKTCDNMRDVTFLYDNIRQLYFPASLLWVVHQGLYIQHIIKSMTKNDNEACLNVSLVKSRSPYKIVNINNLHSVDAFFDNEDTIESILKECPDCHTNMKEFLNLFEIQQEKSRTLVFFSERHLEQDIVDTLYRLQSEKNVQIILVSIIPDIFKFKQFPRHMKFLLTNHIFEPLVDVIKNPEFNRFEVQDFSANINTRRSCLENVTIVLVPSNEFELYLNQLIINSIINLNSEILKVHVLVDIYMNLFQFFYDSLSTFSTSSLFSFSHALLSGITKAGLLAGMERKVFLFITHSDQPSSIRTIKNKLKNSGEVVVEVFPNCFSEFMKRRYHNGDTATYQYDYNLEKDLLNLFDTVVDVGCK